ncbi:MAG: hypothetical protein GY722_29155 [bacterium]|nr:hypothetical protein [bacterium]
MPEDQVIEPDEIDVPPAQLPVKAFHEEMERAGFNAASALAEINYRADALVMVRKVALAQLVPSDFVLFGNKCYLQAQGATRLCGILGIAFPSDEELKERIIDEGDGEFTVMVTGKVGSTVLKTTDFVIGSRSSTDKFYDKFDNDGARIRPKRSDVIKAAYTNFRNRGYAGFLGVQNMTIEELKQAGFKRYAEIGGVTFKSGSQGGGSTMVAPWGPGKGKPYTELDDKDLRGYLKNAQGQLDDPEKAKFKKNNEKVISHITDILHQRSQGEAKDE